MKRILLSIGLMLTLLPVHRLHAKDCPSELPGKLHQFNDTISANMEIVLGTYINNQKGGYDDYYKPMVNTAAQIIINKNSLLFFNGAFKYLTSRHENDTGEVPGGRGSGKGNNKFRFGLRDLYFQNSDESYRVKVGFLTSTLNDQLLLDERGAGFDVMKKFSFMQWRLFGASVLFDFQREGRACVSKTTFDRRDYDEEGRGKPKDFSQYYWGTNLAFNLSSASVPAPVGDDEFQAVSKSSALTVPFVIDITYFGEGYDYAKDRRHFAAVHNAYTLWVIDYSLDGAFQRYHGDTSFGYIGKLSKRIFTDSWGLIRPFAGYTAYTTIKGDEPFAPRFSNLFLSDRLQYLTRDNNLLFYGINYRPVNRLIFEIAHYRKIDNPKSMELDINATVYYTENAKLKAGYNFIERTDRENSYYHQYYLEVRHIF